VAPAVGSTMVVEVIMAVTRPEHSDQGKHLFTLQYLHAKPSWLLLVMFLFASFVQAQEGRIHRCVGENGEPFFSDQRCAQAAASAHAEHSNDAPPVSATDATGPKMATTIPETGKPPITQTCATSPEDLRDRVVSAFESSNAVSFSGLFLWDGFGQGSAIAPLRDLSRLIHEPLTSIELESTLLLRERDRDDYRDYRRQADDLLELLVRTISEGDRRVPYESVSRFELHEQLGCWWLLLP
jgi:hypothetical protein